MFANTTVRMPRLPKAARDAGATKIVRCGKTTFSVGYTLADGDLDQPGNGTAVVAALRTWAGNDFQVEWDGRQGSGIILVATA